MKIEIKESSVGFEIRLSDGEPDEFQEVLARLNQRNSHWRYDPVYRV